MKYRELITAFKKKNLRLISYGKVLERGKIYQLYKIVANSNSSKTLVIMSGFHGEEFNGPISLLQIINKIIEYARKKKVNLIIYPCLNPSGFDLRQRYNASDEIPNNDVLRYEIKKGEWRGIVRPKQKFLRYKIIYSRAKEVRLFQKDLIKYGRIPVGILDIHQDDELGNSDFYAYIFDKKPLYKKIMAKIDKLGKRCRDVKPLMVDEKGLAFNDTIDKDGFIMTHDGSITDMFWRLGTVYSVVSETNLKTSLQKVAAINKMWVQEIVGLIVKNKKKDIKLKIKI